MEKDKTGVEMLLVMIMGILFGMVLISFTSCEEKKETKKIETPKELSKHSENYSLIVNEYTYEGCEYIVVDFGKSKWGSHKGNCKNQIHKK